MSDSLERAIEHLAAGEWQKAHEIVQQDKSTLAAWLHGIVHLLEGDLDNARLVQAGRAPVPGRRRGAGGDRGRSARRRERRVPIGRCPNGSVYSAAHHAGRGAVMKRGGA